MKTYFRCVDRASAALLVLALCACVSPIVDYQSDVDFARYQTVMLSPAGEEAVRSLDENRAYQALQKYFLQHRLRVVSENADLLAKVHFTAYTRFEANEVFWGAGLHRDSFGLGITTPVLLDERKRYRMEVELIDVARRQVVWKALSAGALEQYYSPRERAEWIDTTVQTILERYPPQGNSD